MALQAGPMTLDDWEGFFIEAGISTDSATTHATKFADEKLTIESLQMLDTLQRYVLLLFYRYDSKQSDGEVPVMLELWGIRSTPLLPLLPGPLWLSMVAPDRALSMS